MSSRKAPVKEFEVTIKVRNNLLKQRRLELGLSAPQFAAKIGVCYPNYCALEAMRTSPLTKDEQWKTIVLKVAAYHGVPPRDLFPPSVLAVKQTTAVRQLSGAQVADFLSEYQQRAVLPANSEAEMHEQREVISRALEDLRPRERRVLACRFGLDDEDEKTRGEIGQEYGCSSVRIQQIEAKALRKLRSNRRLFRDLDLDAPKIGSAKASAED